MGFCQQLDGLANKYGFGNKGVGFTDPNSAAVAPSVFAIKQDIDVVKVGINYRFWSAAPVVARY